MSFPDETERVAGTGADPGAEPPERRTEEARHLERGPLDAGHAAPALKKRGTPISAYFLTPAPSIDYQYLTIDEFRYLGLVQSAVFASVVLG